MPIITVTTKTHICDVCGRSPRFNEAGLYGWVLLKIEHQCVGIKMPHSDIDTQTDPLLCPDCRNAAIRRLLKPEVLIEPPVPAI